MSPRTAAVIWWVLMVTYAVSNAYGLLLFVLDPTKARFAQIVVWALVGGRLLFYELRYARTMAAMLKDQPAS